MDSDGLTAISGTTGQDFPTTPGALQPEPGGEEDAYVAVMDIGDTEPFPYPTESPDPTPTPTESTEPTESPSPSPSPTGSTTPDPDPTDEPSDDDDVVIEADVDVTIFGEEIHLSGEVRVPGSCPGAEIQVSKRVFGAEAFKEVGLAETDGPEWSLDVAAQKNAFYKAAVTGDELCAGATSAPIDVRVKAAIDVSSSGSCASSRTVKGVVRPNQAGTRTLLQSRRHGEWVTVDRDRLSDASRFALKRPSCSGIYRIVWRSQSKTNLGAVARL